MLEQSFKNMDTDIVRNILMCTYSEMVSYSYALNEISTIQIAKNLQKAQVTVYLPKIKKSKAKRKAGFYFCMENYLNC